MKKKLSVTDLDLKGKKALVRVDFNVPLDKEGKITDDTRIKASLPTIEYILQQGGSVVLMSHLGRPKDKRVTELSLAPCAYRLSELLGKKVKLARDCIDKETENQAATLEPGEVLLLENLRFHRAEEHPEEDPSFAEKLSRYGDCYINDAFGTAHRKHSSTYTIAQYFPGKSAAGFLMEKEIEFLGNALLNPKRPFYAIIGGAKISTKLGVIKSLLAKADALFIGGGMAYTFYLAEGYSIGSSIYEADLVPQAKEILEEAKKGSGKLFLPEDNLIAESLDDTAETRVVDVKQGIPEGFSGVDIGPKTIKKYEEELKKAQTILWNGPLGVFEIPGFAEGTMAIARAVANSQATTIVGGGDSISAIQAAGVADKIAHISTGGGASLEYIEYGTLPGIEVLSDKVGNSY